MQKDSFGYYGLVVKPSFDQAVDAAMKPLRIPIPDRAAKREAQGVYRAHLLEESQMQTAAQMQVHDYQMGDDGLPVASIRTGPSESGDAPAFQRMSDHTQTASENAQAALLRRQYEADATERMEGQRTGALRDISKHEGGYNTVIQGEGVAAESYRIDSDDDLSPDNAPRDTHPMGVRHGVAPRMPVAAGRVPNPQFPTFREQNYGDRAPSSAAAAAVQPGQDESYEAMRLRNVTSRYLRGQ